MSNPASSASPQLKRVLGFWDSVAINVGIVIGVGIFRTQGAIANYVDTGPLIILTWAVGGLVALAGVFCYAELSSRYPQTGGTYVYLREAYGKPAAFLYGWAEFVIMRPGSVAGVAYILITYLRNFIQLGPEHERWMTIAAIMLFTALNIGGLHIGTGIQNVLTTLKIAAIVAMAVIIFGVKGIALPGAGTIEAITHGKWQGIAPALIPVLWTYGGWHQSTFMSGEFKDTRKALPLSLVTSIAIVAALYIIINAAYLRVMTPAEMAGTKAIASDVFTRMFGGGAGLMVTLAVLISASGALNSTILTGARLPFAVAQDYPRINWLTKIDPRFDTPLVSFVVNGILSAALVIWGNFEQLLFFFAFGNWLFFGLTGLSVFKLRGINKAAGNYEMAGYPWMPALFVLSSFLLCFITVQSAPRESLFGAFLLLSGIPAYLLVRGKRA